MPPLTSVPFGAPYYSAQLQTNCLLVVLLNGSTTRHVRFSVHASATEVEQIKGPAPHNNRGGRREGGTDH